MLNICSKEQFLEHAKKVDHIVCFGTGKLIEKFKIIFDCTGIEEKIACFVDNDKNKHYTNIHFGNRTIKIVPFEYLKKMNLSKTIFFVTCAKYSEILDQINQDESLKDIETYCLLHLIALEWEESRKEHRLPESFKRSDRILIPKVIHYCWFGRNPLPERYKKWMESWHKFCPDYEIIEWNEDNYDISKNKYMRQAYEQKKWGFVPDVARLDIIYQYGGIYLDTDVELVQNLDDLLWQKGFAAFEGNEYVALGLGFGAVKGLSIIKELMDYYDNINFINEDGSLNLTASPVWQTEFLRQKGLVPNGSYQIIEDMAIYPGKVLNGKDIKSRQIKLMPYTKAIHHYDGSWLSEDKRNGFIRFEAEMNTLKNITGS